MGQNFPHSYLIQSFPCFCTINILYHCIGNMLKLFQCPVGEADFVWQSQYGKVVWFKGILRVSPFILLFHITWCYFQL